VEDTPIRAPTTETPSAWNEPIYHVNDPQNDIILGELVMMFYEIMSAYNLTDESCKKFFDLINTILPENSNKSSFAEAKSHLERAHKSRVIVVPLCPNDCIAYINCQHPTLAHYKHDHRTFCHVCKEERYITINGKRQNRKVGYYLPMGKWLRDIFASKELETERDQHTGMPQPPGHVSHSKGWHDKVTANPKMAGESRNQALIGLADGIPIFKNKNSLGVTPIAFRSANLPDSISMKFRHIHLAALYPHEFYKPGKRPGTHIRKRRKPKSLNPLMYMLADDLLHWEDGCMVTDTSLHQDDPRREFKLSTVLLYWTGDYPGLAEATGFAHGVHLKMCHWCEIRGVYSKGISRSVFGNYRRCECEDLQ
jgi:hypothetical protein